MTRTIRATPLTARDFAAFGDVIALKPRPDKLINGGRCGRHHDLARIDVAEGRAGISLFDAELCSLPYRLELMERHPLGSQAFIPVSQSRFLVVAAEDAGGRPGTPRAFIAGPGQSVNMHRGVWHGVLAPLDGPGLYAVVDRIGEGANLEEHWFETPFTITKGTGHRT
ncbi:Ureidoglycolate hydrolase [Maritimibacter sp. 55A14]|uniref:ureidoglycolate lyase n=1 Tax=Maritimibacter sp. 55A14 TaxID=2174844 RepID=UPI000D60BDDC|nr:ureidoglycolate lyase [Maritimibacter sp. 55A14]PWE31432.1 Ureidoglycolate hydrolase [Maritimibacter sp. 55A14]